MFEQIVKNMHVPIEISSQLTDEQRDVLHYEIRKEQIRRYNEWVKEADKTPVVTKSTISMKKTKLHKQKRKEKRVNFSEGPDGNVVVQRVWLDKTASEANNLTSSDNLENGSDTFEENGDQLAKSQRRIGLHPTVEIRTSKPAGVTSTFSSVETHLPRPLAAEEDQGKEGDHAQQSPPSNATEPGSIVPKIVLQASSGLEKFNIENHTLPVSTSGGLNDTTQPVQTKRPAGPGEATAAPRRYRDPSPRPSGMSFRAAGADSGEHRTPRRKVDTNDNYSSPGSQPNSHPEVKFDASDESSTSSSSVAMPRSGGFHRINLDQGSKPGNLDQVACEKPVESESVAVKQLSLQFSLSKKGVEKSSTAETQQYSSSANTLQESLSSQQENDKNEYEETKVVPRNPNLKGHDNANKTSVGQHNSLANYSPRDSFGEVDKPTATSVKATAKTSLNTTVNNTNNRNNHLPSGQLVPATSDNSITTPASNYRRVSSLIKQRQEELFQLIHGNLLSRRRNAPPMENICKVNVPSTFLADDKKLMSSQENDIGSSISPSGTLWFTALEASNLMREFSLPLNLAGKDAVKNICEKVPRWFHGPMTMQNTEQLLRSVNKQGAFLVRVNQSFPGYTISVLWNGSCFHLPVSVISPTAEATGGSGTAARQSASSCYQLLGNANSQQFPSLVHLVNFHKANPIPQLERQYLLQAIGQQADKLDRPDYLDIFYVVQSTGL